MVSDGREIIYSGLDHGLILQKLHKGKKQVLDFQSKKALDIGDSIIIGENVENNFIVSLDFLVLWDHKFHCGTLKLLEGH